MALRIAAALALCVALVAAFILTKGAERDAGVRALAARLAEPALPPDQAILAARAFREIASGAPAAGGREGRARPEDLLEGRAKLRFLLATGFTMRELGVPRPEGSGPEDPSATAVADAVAAAAERERSAIEAAGRLASEHLEETERWLRDAPDPVARRRAAEALAGSADARAQAALRARVRDESDESVRVAAYGAAVAIARRAGDDAGLIETLVAAARVPSLGRRAFGTARAIGGAGVGPVYLALLERPGLALDERETLLDALVTAAGPERAATLPRDGDAAAVRAWWEGGVRPR
jgi:plasmid stabilization system protein ParE